MKMETAQATMNVTQANRRSSRMFGLYPAGKSGVGLESTLPGLVDCQQNPLGDDRKDDDGEAKPRGQEQPGETVAYL